VITLEKPGTPVDAVQELMHHGVLGQKWGVRRNRSGPLLSDSQKHTAKKIAIGVGVAAAVAGTAFVAYKVHQDPSKVLSLVKKSSTTSVGKTAVKKMTEQEPTDIIHVARGKSKGYRFQKTGGVADPLLALPRAVSEDRAPPGYFEKFGTHGEKVAASFLDPEGRKDFSGRPIFHTVVVPKHLSAGINNVDDVVTHIWPKIKDTYDYT
jgi:hypothetical protein